MSALSSYTLLAAIMALTVCPWCGFGKNEQAARTGPTESKVKQLVAHLSEQYQIPGMVVAVFDDTSITLKVAYGVRRMDGKDKVTIDDKFHIGSCTKAMTITVIAMLIEEGKLSWDTQVLEVFPDWKDSIHPEHRRASLVQFLRHTAGIEPFTAGVEFHKVPKFEGDVSTRRSQFAQWLLSRKPFETPGKKRIYSNAGFTIGAAMAEKVASSRWEELIAERLFKQLGIEAGFGWPAVKDPKQPWGHWEIQGSLSPHPPSHSYQTPYLVAPCGDVHMSIGDLAKFAQLHLSALRGKPKLLQGESFKFVHSKDEHGYALGWYVTEQGEIGAHGSAGTFYAIASLYPQLNLGIVLAGNAGHERAAAGCTRLGKELVSLWTTEGKAEGTAASPQLSPRAGNERSRFPLEVSVFY